MNSYENNLKSQEQIGNDVRSYEGGMGPHNPGSKKLGCRKLRF